MSQDTIVQVWLLSLGIFVAVLLVVAALLTLILRTSTQIHGGVSAIWTAGQKVANNTIQLSLLHHTNHVAARILKSAVGVATATGMIASHATGCPGCPACVIGDAKGRR